MDMDEPMEEIERKTFEDIPEELVEKIFQHLSMYGEIQTCRLVSHQWDRLAIGVMGRVHKLLCRSNRFEWFLLDTPRTTEYHLTTNIAERCSHAAAFHPPTASVFVFGGCTASYTTFNDLWRFDLSRNLWIRPMPMGTYPTPKACASLVEYRNYLILYGGWSKSSPNPIHQTVMFFRELHIYDPKTNFWTELSSDTSGPPLAGHSATISNDLMLIFGGSYGSEHNLGGLHGSGISNSIWVFDFTNSHWSLPATSSPKPSPRYGQTQIKLDDRRLLIIGGCGGPNLMFSDVWMLTIEDEGEWRWQEINVVNPELSAPHIWSHQGCRVGNRILFLSKPLRSRGASASYRSIDKAVGRGTVPPRGDVRARTWVPPATGGLDPSVPSTSGSNLVPPRRRLISSKSLDEKNPPPSPSSERLGDKRTAGELQRARSIPAIIVGEIPKLVVTHDGNDSGSSSGGESSDSQMKEEKREKRSSKTPAGGGRGGVPNSSASPSGPLDISVVVQRNAQQMPNRGRQCVAMASSNLVPNQAEMVEAPNAHPNVEVDHQSYRQGLGRGNLPSVSVEDDADCKNPMKSQTRSASVSSSSSDDGNVPPSPSRMVRNTRHPSVKPNASKNREKQLEMLRRMEEFLRSRNIAAASSSDHSASSSGGTSPTALRFRPSSPPPKTKHHSRQSVARPSKKNPMQIYSLDIQPVLRGENQAVWSVLDDSIDDAPEDTILYSLVKGRGELILFGGLRSGASAETAGNLDVTPYTHLHLITNDTYLLKPAGLPVD